MKQEITSMGQELLRLHEHMCEEWPKLLRVAIALYDQPSDLIHTFVKSSSDIQALEHYSVTLSSVPSLQKVAEKKEPRLIQDLSIFKDSPSIHSKALLEADYKSSFTVPLYLNNKLIGFSFYDSTDSNYFTEKLQQYLIDYSRLMESILISELLPIKALIGMVQTTKEITKFRDEETGEHLIRMAYYVELIATELSNTYDISDEEIEYMRLYAPLHDIGKIAISDDILMKPGVLTPKEYEIIKTHVDEGVRMVDIIVKNFDFQQLHHIDILYSVVSEHHERYDGSGYPKGLKETDISLAGKICAIADVFDAMVSRRVYHRATDPEKVFEYLLERRGTLFDPECVDAFIKCKEKVLKIHEQFKDTLNFKN